MRGVLPVMAIVVVSISVAEFYLIALARQNNTKPSASMKIKQPFKTALFSILLACGVVSTQPALAAGQTVRVGIMSGEDEDVWRAVAANAARHGLTVKVTTFSDYTQPNEALSQHDLDANSFPAQTVSRRADSGAPL